jgi:hypothetical protein
MAKIAKNSERDLINNRDKSNDRPAFWAVARATLSKMSKIDGNRNWRYRKG